MLSITGGFAADTHPLNYTEARIGESKAKPVSLSITGAFKEAVMHEGHHDPLGGRLVQVHGLSDLR